MTAKAPSNALGPRAAMDELGREGRQPVGLPLREWMLNDDIPDFDVPKFT